MQPRRSFLSTSNLLYHPSPQHHHNSPRSNALFHPQSQLSGSQPPRHLPISARLKHYNARMEAPPPEEIAFPQPPATPPPNWVDFETIRTGLQVCMLNTDKVEKQLEQSEKYSETQEKRLFLLVRIESTKDIYVPVGSGPSRLKLRFRRRWLKWRYFCQYRYHANFDRMVQAVLLLVRMQSLGSMWIKMATGGTCLC